MLTLKIHIVKKGETMDSIAEKYGVSQSELHDMNKHLSDPKDVMEGMKLKVPNESPKEQPVVVEQTSEVETDLSSNEEAEHSRQEELTVAERFPLPNDFEKPKPIPYIREDEYFDKQIAPYDESTSYDELLEAASYTNMPNTFEDSWTPEVVYEPIYFDPYVVQQQQQSQQDYERLYYASYRNGCGCHGAPINYGYGYYY